MDLYTVSWTNLKGAASARGLRFFYLEQESSYEVIAASPSYGLRTIVTGDDAVDFEVVYKAISIPVGSEQEAIGLSIATNMSADGKALTAVYPATPGWKTYFTSRGDVKGPPIERSMGTPILVEFDDTEDRGIKEVTFSFAEPVEIHDGEAFYTPIANWAPIDYLSFGVRLNATPATAATGDGNANKAALGGGLSLFVPAAGDGAWNIDLANAVPVPMETKIEPPSGFWNCDMNTGTVTAGLPLQSSFNLFDFALPESWLVRNVTLGNPFGVWEIDTYLAEWCHQNWDLIVMVEKNSPGAGVLSGSIMPYRLKTT